jgi:hypothetical protein
VQFIYSSSYAFIDLYRPTQDVPGLLRPLASNTSFVGFWLSWRAYGLPQYSEFNVLDQIGLKNCAYFKGKIVATA